MDSSEVGKIVQEEAYMLDKSMKSKMSSYPFTLNKLPGKDVAGKETTVSSSTEQRFGACNKVAVATKEKDVLRFDMLPRELQDRILSFLSFDEISGCRLVSKSFDAACSVLLNAGFARVEKDHGRIMHEIKIQLPRRESERRNHALSRHSDILTAVETRLSLLNMTYTKFIDVDLCCFIPGKVLDEIFAVLGGVTRSLATKEEPRRPHELLQELRDISSMAMEYFDEKIAPNLKQTSNSVNVERLATFALGLTPSTFPSIFGPRAPEEILSKTPVATTSAPHLATCATIRQNNLAGAVTKLQRQSADQSKALAVYKKELINLRATAKRSNKKLAEQSKVIGEQNRKLEEFARKYDVMIGELRSELTERKKAENPPLTTPETGAKTSALETPKSGERKGKRGKRTEKEEATEVLPVVSPKRLRSRRI